MKKVIKTNATWFDREEYPFDPHFQKVKHGRMHYVDVGRGQPIVMVHGSPTWSFMYRNLIKGLSGEYRCIAPDNLGFGLSDKPKYFSYKPEAQAENFDCFIQELGLRNIILLVHDYGGPIGLNYAIQNPHNVSRIIMMNTWMWSRKGDFELEKVNKLLKKRVGRFLYERMNFATRFLLKQAVHNPANLSKPILNHYINAFSTRESRKSAMVSARELIDSSDWFESLWRAREAIADTPALLLWGMDDPFIGTNALDMWHQLFHNQRMIRLASTGHLVAEDQKAQLCGLIKDFLHDMDASGA